MIFKTFNRYANPVMEKRPKLRILVWPKKGLGWPICWNQIEITPKTCPTDCPQAS